MAKLRIKADKELTELERFGFVHKKEQRNQYEHYAYLEQDKSDLKILIMGTLICACCRMKI